MEHTRAASSACRAQQAQQASRLSGRGTLQVSPLRPACKASSKGSKVGTARPGLAGLVGQFLHASQQLVLRQAGQLIHAEPRCACRGRCCALLHRRRLLCCSWRAAGSGWGTAGAAS